ncbi:hypothetical protein D7207_33620 [Burkholderia cepacia]|uniref:Uncharacterized protein n=2 Tax=Burkholderia TaxID=32008 RepID=A0A365QN09_9BURK|nr:hypothetical protein C5O75_004770 [Burkholderia cepacia]RBB35258.1 hypothetical protein DPV79_29315 [Burkholderia reimsis]THJ49372.1 hypothetical protein E9536_32765 [Burkholderia sp. LS-044]MBA9896592.1 hypothetical protein [Burkholderia cepacia]MBA9944317.1 hypothetical protein [Burkholderia cepacia]
MSRDGRIRITVRRHCSANHRPPDRRFGCNSRDKNGPDGAEAPPFASYNAVPSTVPDRPPCQPPSPSFH